MQSGDTCERFKISHKTWVSGCRVPALRHVPIYETCGDSLPSVEKSTINQRFLRFWKKNGCVFLFPQSDDISGGLPHGIGYGE